MVCLFKQDSGNTNLDKFSVFILCFWFCFVFVFFSNLYNARDNRDKKDLLDQKEKREILYT